MEDDEMSDATASYFELGVKWALDKQEGGENSSGQWWFEFLARHYADWVLQAKEQDRDAFVEGALSIWKLTR